jgi:hypothetical protein
MAAAISLPFSLMTPIFAAAFADFISPFVAARIFFFAASRAIISPLLSIFAQFHFRRRIRH